MIFLITDGEERGLLGADLFMREHPWRHDPGVVLNFEARGTGGPSYMFETSTGNAWMIRALQAAVPQAQATSVAYEIYRRMPNDTDLTVFKAGGLAGMNFCLHRASGVLPSPAGRRRSSRSPQCAGTGPVCAFRPTRVFGNQDLTTPHSGNAVYFPTRLTSLIVYPAEWVMPIAWITMLGLAAAAWFGRRTRGRWIAIPLAIMTALAFLVAVAAPGADYLLEWPLLAGVLSFALLVTAPQTPGLGWRVAAMIICPAAVFLLMIPFASTLIVALGLRAAAPVLALDVLGMLTCVMPQLLLVFRSAPSQLVLVARAVVPAASALVPTLGVSPLLFVIEALPLFTRRFLSQAESFSSPDGN